LIFLFARQASYREIGVGGAAVRDWLRFSADGGGHCGGDMATVKPSCDLTGFNVTFNGSGRVLVFASIGKRRRSGPICRDAEGTTK
jgi:hypothetical protein